MENCIPCFFPNPVKLNKKRASAILTYILSSLNDVEALEESHPGEYKNLIHSLLILKMFLLCALKTGNIITMGSFFVRMQDGVFSIDTEVPSSNFAEIYGSFLQEMNEWFTSVMDSNKLQSCCFTREEVLEILLTFVKNLELNPYSKTSKLIQATLLPEQMMFLIHLIRFSTPEEDFMVHAGAIAVRAASFCIAIDYKRYEGLIEDRFENEMRIKFSTLARNIEPVDPRVCKIYAEALSSTNLAIELDLTVMENLISHLLSSLWELLLLSTPAVVALRNQLQELHEGLRVIRKHCKSKKVNLIIKTKIGGVVRDAGVFIFSMYQADIQEQSDLGILQDLLEAIKIILGELGNRDLQVLTLSNGCTTQLAFVDFLLEKLMDLSSSNAESNAKTQFQTIQNEFASLRSLLGSIVKLRRGQEELQALWNGVLEVAYRAEDLVDYQMVDYVPHCLSSLFDSLVSDIGNIKSEIKVIIDRSDVKVMEATANHIQIPEKNRSMTENIVGLNDEAQIFLNWLMRGSKKLKIRAIVGMAGLGKTTFAGKVYNDPSVWHHFPVRAFATVSQTVDKKRVLINLLKQVAPEKTLQNASEADVNDVANELRRSLKGRAYLIVLDDIWEAEVWQVLRESFPDDSVGSRIIFTSRCHDVAHEPYELRPLNGEESLDLLQTKLFDGNCWPVELADLEMQIAKICKGVPLTIVIVAGVLRSTKAEEWKKIVDNLSLENLAESHRNTMEFSYRHLPEHLKPCFLYLAAYKEDEVISVRRLLYLWMAEGWIRKAENKHLFDTAEEYLRDLVHRSLLLVDKKEYDGRLKRCRIHDIVHEFCLQKSKNEDFLHLRERIKSDDPATLKLRRLRLSSGGHNINSKLRESKAYLSRVRSLHFETNDLEVSVLTQVCKLLRVLDLVQTGYFDIVIPSEIGLLVCLTYLAFKGNDIRIPSQISKLTNLQTLILRDGRVMNPIHLPSSLWNLKKLKHLHVKPWGCLPTGNLHSSSDLPELDRISHVGIYGRDSMEGVLEKFPNIRLLKYRLDNWHQHGKKMVEIVVPEPLRKLQVLVLSSRNRGAYKDFILSELSLPENLKELRLELFRLSESSLSSIGKLPNLEVLTLRRIEFEGDTWTMKEDDFPKLISLELMSENLREWSSSDYQLEYLERLILRDCLYLEEMPPCLEYISVLQKIAVYGCPANVQEIAKNLKEVHVGNGNSDLMIHITDNKWTKF